MSHTRLDVLMAREGWLVGWPGGRGGEGEDMRVRKAGFWSKSLLIGHKGCQEHVFKAINAYLYNP